MLILPVYLLRFAYEYQFRLKFSDEYLCIFPPNILEKNEEVKDVSPYQIKSHSIKYLEYLYQLVNSNETLTLKQEAFSTFIDL